MASLHRPRHTLDTRFDVADLLHRMSRSPPHDRDLHVKQLFELATSQDTNSLKQFVRSPQGMNILNQWLQQAISEARGAPGISYANGSSSLPVASRDFTVAILTLLPLLPVTPLAVERCGVRETLTSLVAAGGGHDSSSSPSPLGIGALATRVLDKWRALADRLDTGGGGHGVAAKKRRREGADANLQGDDTGTGGEATPSGASLAASGSTTNPGASSPSYETNSALNGSKERGGGGERETKRRRRVRFGDGDGVSAYAGIAQTIKFSIVDPPARVAAQRRKLRRDLIMARAAGAPSVVVGSKEEGELARGKGGATKPVWRIPPQRWSPLAVPPRAVPRGSQSHERDVQTARTRAELAAVYPRNLGIPATPSDKLPRDEGRPSNVPVRIPLLNPKERRALESKKVTSFSIGLIPKTAATRAATPKPMPASAPTPKPMPASAPMPKSSTASVLSNDSTTITSKTSNSSSSDSTSSSSSSSGRSSWSVADRWSTQPSSTSRASDAAPSKASFPSNSYSAPASQASKYNPPTSQGPRSYPPSQHPPHYYPPPSHDHRQQHPPHTPSAVTPSYPPTAGASMSASTDAEAASAPGASKHTPIAGAPANSSSSLHSAESAHLYANGTASTHYTPIAGATSAVPKYTPITGDHSTHPNSTAAAVQHAQPPRGGHSSPPLLEQRGGSSFEYRKPQAPAVALTTSHRPAYARARFPQSYSPSTSETSNALQTTPSSSSTSVSPSYEPIHAPSQVSSHPAGPDPSTASSQPAAPRELKSAIALSKALNALRPDSADFVVRPALNMIDHQLSLGHLNATDFQLVKRMRDNFVEQRALAQEVSKSSASASASANTGTSSHTEGTAVTTSPPPGITSAPPPGIVTKSAAGRKRKTPEELLVDLTTKNEGGAALEGGVVEGGEWSMPVYERIGSPQGKTATGSGPIEQQHGASPAKRSRLSTGAEVHEPAEKPHFPARGGDRFVSTNPEVHATRESDETNASASPYSKFTPFDSSRVPSQSSPEENKHSTTSPGGPLSRKRDRAPTPPMPHDHTQRYPDGEYSQVALTAPGNLQPSKSQSEGTPEHYLHAGSAENANPATSALAHPSWGHPQHAPGARGDNSQSHTAARPNGEKFLPLSGAKPSDVSSSSEPRLETGPSNGQSGSERGPASGPGLGPDYVPRSGSSQEAGPPGPAYVPRSGSSQEAGPPGPAHVHRSGRGGPVHGRGGPPGPHHGQDRLAAAAAVAGQQEPQRWHGPHNADHVHQQPPPGAYHHHHQPPSGAPHQQPPPGAYQQPPSAPFHSFGGGNGGNGGGRFPPYQQPPPFRGGNDGFRSQWPPLHQQPPHQQPMPHQQPPHQWPPHQQPPHSSGGGGGGSRRGSASSGGSPLGSRRRHRDRSRSRSPRRDADRRRRTDADRRGRRRSRSPGSRDRSRHRSASRRSRSRSRERHRRSRDRRSR